MQNETRKQRGGTLLGLVIGLVVGLAIAFVVALMITKSPAPLNKQGKNDKNDKPVSTALASNTDPNQPMYRNKEAVKEASKDFLKEGDSQAADAAKPAAKPESPVVAAKAESKGVASTNKTEEKWSYYLQTGAFRNSNDAEGMRAKLALLGFEAGISESISQNGTLYRVRLGPYSQIDVMNKARSKLTENGLEATVSRIPK